MNPFHHCFVGRRVLSKLLDRSGQRHQLGYHPKCKNLGLTHLSSADDIMVFTDGKVRSIESIVDVFDYFAKISGLSISMEKSTIYYAEISEEEREELINQFQFASGTLPVRYLGLPLLTRQMWLTIKCLLKRSRAVFLYGQTGFFPWLGGCSLFVQC